MKTILTALIVTALFVTATDAELVYNFHEDAEDRDVLAIMTLGKLPATADDIAELEFTDLGRATWPVLPRFYPVGTLGTTIDARVVDDGAGGLTSSGDFTAFVDERQPEIIEFLMVFDGAQDVTDTIGVTTTNVQTFRLGNWMIVPEPSSFGLFAFCGAAILRRFRLRAA